MAICITTYSSPSVVLFLSLVTFSCVITYCSSELSSGSVVSASNDGDGDGGWTLNTVLNPNCDKFVSCSMLPVKPDLLYTQSTDNKTSLHFITSTFGGFPGLLITRVRSPDALQIDWDNMERSLEGSLFLLPRLPENTIGIIFLTYTQLWQLSYNRSLNCDSTKCSFNYSSYQPLTNQTISIGIEIDNVLSSYEDSPHLQFTPSSMHIDLQMKYSDKSQAKSKTEDLQLLIFTSGDTFHENYDKSFDDEHSPGIFIKKSFVFSKDNSSEVDSYLQWKPVAYKSIDRVMSKTLEIDSAPLTEIDFASLNTSLNTSNLPIFAFHQQFLQERPVYLLNISFVQDDDEDDLIVWSLVFGLDPPPKQGLSTFIRFMIYGGVGLSCVILFFTLLYVSIKSWQRSKTQRESGLINEVFLDY